MSLIKSHILENTVESFAGSSIFQCWEKQEKSHSVYVFSIYIENQQELSNNCKEAKRFIATYIQGLLIDKDVERWNLYLVFLVKGNVDPKIKYVIEQDKFSSRKIVLDNINGCPDDNKSIELIEDTLFKLTIDSNPVPVTDSIEKLLRDNHSRVFYFNEDNKEKITEEVFENMLNLLGTNEDE
jgi:hypothetical protein